MPTKLTTTVDKIRLLSNRDNSHIIMDFHDLMKETGASERHQNNNLKAILAFSLFLDYKPLIEVDKREDILVYLQSKIKGKDLDPDKQWITTWNDYLWRIKYFYRWLINTKDKEIDTTSHDNWTTPSFINIRMKRTKRLSLFRLFMQEIQVYKRKSISLTYPISN